MASTLAFRSVLTAKAIKKCCRLNATNCGSVTFARSIVKPKRSCISQVERRRERRIRCKDESEFELRSPDDSSAPMEVVAEFYRLINDRDEGKLLDLIWDECSYEDLVFYIPFQGKEQIRGFLHELMDAMDPHVMFVLENVSNGWNNSVGVIWHLEWQKKRIPFATGYNYFEFHKVGDKHLISKIRGLEELPLKPGDLILKLLKMFATLCDHYPTAAEGLLSVPDASHDVMPVISHIFGLLSAPHTARDVMSVILHNFGGTQDHSNPSKHK